MPKFLHSLTSQIERRPILWTCVHAMLAIILMILLNKSFFYHISSDGFSREIYLVSTVPLAEWDALMFVHAVRFFIVFPLWLIHTHPIAPLINALFIIATLWPLVRAPVQEDARPSPWRVVLFYLPCLASLRTICVTAAIGYLLLIFYTRRRSRMLLILSALFANLSSASVLLWLIACGFNWSNLKRFKRTAIALTMLLCLSLSVSVMKKISFFQSYVEKHYGIEITITEDENDYRETLMEFTTLIKAVTRKSTFIASVRKEHYLRAGLYLAVFFGLIHCLMISFPTRRERTGIFWFFLPGMLVFFLEGLGVMALVSSIIIFLLEKRQFMMGKTAAFSGGQPQLVESA
jgi:hypothetical protein